jgi:hypothetical protein
LEGAAASVDGCLAASAFMLYRKYGNAAAFNAGG